MKETLFLCGAGNPEGVRLAQRIQDETPRWKRILLLDDDASRHGRTILGVPIDGPFATLAHADPESVEVANLVARTTVRRAAAREKIRSYGLPFARLVDPSVDTFGAELATDLVVFQNAVVGPEVVLGEGSVLNLGAIVGHESRLAECCVVGPGAVINARVVLEDGAYVGTNATVLPELRVGAWATIAAGSVAMHSIPPNATVMGVPAKTLVPGRARPGTPVATGSAGGTRSEVGHG